MNKNENFFDARTLFAAVLVGAMFLLWQHYMHQKYPDFYKEKPAVTSTTTAPDTGKAAAAPSAGTKTSVPEAAPQAPSATEKTLKFESDTLAFEISSYGMGVKGVEIRKYKDRAGEPVKLGHPEEKLLALETRQLGHVEPLMFNIEKVNPNLFVGRAQAGGMTITKTMEIMPERYLIEYKVVASGSDEHFVGLTTELTEEVEPVATGTLHPLFQKQEFYIDAAETKDRILFGKDDIQKAWTGVRIASVGSQFFTQALIDKSQVIPEAKARVNHAGKAAELSLQYPILNRAQNFELAYTAFVGPKSLELLHQIDSGIEKVVDFGYFNWIGRHLLELLRMFYGLVGNWGAAVILMTLLVRLVVFPVNLYSYKSMKAMQVLQPQIQALKEKYKDDQQKQQQETMVLMREHKVNPLGGCLPILLQIPIFFAFYQVLGNSIELYQAPFALWIHDLSLKDPFYILPVLMGVTMFFQQKLTPTATMDPAQAKVLLMMPIIFTFFMFSLPSGLTLYMLVGAIFSVAQQTYFMRTKTHLGRAK